MSCTHKIYSEVVTDKDCKLIPHSLNLQCRLNNLECRLNRTRLFKMGCFWRHGFDHCSILILLTNLKS